MSKPWRKIALDPGHGGKDCGAVSSDGDLLEKNVNRLVVARLDEHLRRMGFETLVVRDNDDYVLLRERARRSNSWGADFYLSVHCNSAQLPNGSIDPRPHGIETFFYSSNTNALAILNALLQTFPEHRNRGAKSANFCVLKETVAPAVLVELEFISNPFQAELLRIAHTQELYAETLARSIDHLSNWI